MGRATPTSGWIRFWRKRWPPLLKPLSSRSVRNAPETSPGTVRLLTLNERLTQFLAPVKGREFFVFHPAFGYFADRYGLKQTAVEYQGKAPGAKRLGDLAERLKNEKVRAVFAQPQYSTAEARALAESTGAKLVTLNDLSPDYEANLEDIARTLAENLQ